MAWNGPHQDWNHASVPFWDFVAGLNLNEARGAGVDHAGPPAYTPNHESPEGPFGPFGPFGGPGGFGAWGGRRGGWGGPWGRRGGGEEWARGWGGRRGSRRHGRRGGPADEEDVPMGEERDAAAAGAAATDEVNEKADSPNTMRDVSDDPPEEVPNPDERPHSRHPHHHHRGHGRRGRGGFRGGCHPFGTPHGPGFHHGPPPPPFGGPGGPFGGPHGFHHPPPPPPFNFDFNAMMAGLAQHPVAQQLRDYIERAQNVATAARGDQNQRGQDESEEEDEDDVESFAPPVDIFDAETKWVIHVALPGAKKEDVGVNWDADRNTLGVTGVVHRPGDETLLAGMVSGERKVGLFRRDVRLPPEGSESKDEVDSFAITAKMEDGVLIISVPKVEKEWEEVTKVNVE